MTDGFHEDLMIEILSRVPVKSLMRFKCLRKSCYALIRDRRFISKHLKNCCNETNSRLLISYIDRDAVSYCPKLVLFLDETLTDLSHQDFNPDAFRQGLVGEKFLKPRFKRPNYFPILRAWDKILGPYDGLFFLEYTVDRSPEGWFICNPATRELKKLPDHRITKYDTDSVDWASKPFLGFGFDSVNDDYKLVFIRPLEDDDPCCMKGDDDDDRQSIWHYIGVYSLNNNCWKVLKFVELKRYWVLSSRSTNWNGVCYWLAAVKTWNDAILAFHLNEEEFQEIKLPDIPEEAHDHLSVAVHNNSLSLLCFDPLVNCSSTWVMNDDYSWTKQSTFGPFLNISSTSRLWKNGGFFAVSKTGDRMLKYDPGTKEFRDMGMGMGNHMFTDIHCYQESLITFKRHLPISDLDR